MKQFSQFLRFVNFSRKIKTNPPLHSSNICSFHAKRELNPLRSCGDIGRTCSKAQKCRHTDGRLDGRTELNTIVPRSVLKRRRRTYNEVKNNVMIQNFLLSQQILSNIINELFFMLHGPVTNKDFRGILHGKCCRFHGKLREIRGQLRREYCEKSIIDCNIFWFINSSNISICSWSKSSKLPFQQKVY